MGTPVLRRHFAVVAEGEAGECRGQGRRRRRGQPGYERREAQLAEGCDAAVGGPVSGFQ